MLSHLSRFFPFNCFSCEFISSLAENKSKAEASLGILPKLAIIYTNNWERFLGDGVVGVGVECSNASLCSQWVVSWL